MVDYRIGGFSLIRLLPTTSPIMHGGYPHVGGGRAATIALDMNVNRIKVGKDGL